MAWSALRPLGERLVQGRKEEGPRAGAGSRRDGLATRPSRRSLRPHCESLEERTLLATPGYDYVLSGYRWSNPARITYSIAPDGVFWDHGTNNLNSTFNAKLGAGQWQAQIARALATWESVANINIAPVSDGPYDFNGLGLAQGDSRFGDVRFGGYVFPNNTTTLAQTYFPPPNGSTAAGDVEINTALGFNIGSSYDLYSVVLHETGHSLGLEHPPNPEVVMAPNYGGIRHGLTAGDIAGIQAIYGARTLDVYQQQGVGISPAAPIDVSASLATNLQATVGNLGLPSIGSSEYFTVQAPSNATGSLSITASAANISMLSPKLSVYDDGGNLLGQASNPTAWSSSVTVSIPGVVAGKRYSIVVTGATGDVFDAGSYNLALSLPQRVSPSGPTTPPVTTPAPPPTTPVAPPVIAADPYEPNGSLATSTWLGRTNQVTLNGLTLTSASDVDFFAFQAARTSSYRVTASGTWVFVYNARGRIIARGYGQVGLPTQRAGTLLYIRTSPAQAAGVNGYALSISTPTPLKFWRTPARQAAAAARAGLARFR